MHRQLRRLGVILSRFANWAAKIDMFWRGFLYHTGRGETSIHDLFGSVEESFRCLCAQY